MKLSEKRMKNLTNKSFIAALTFLLVVISIAVRVHSKDALGDENYTNSSTVAKSRMKRYLIFQPGSRILVSSRFVRKIISKHDTFFSSTVPH